MNQLSFLLFLLLPPFLYPCQDDCEGIDSLSDEAFALSSTGPSECCPRTQQVEDLTVNNQTPNQDRLVITLLN